MAGRSQAPTPPISNLQPWALAMPEEPCIHQNPPLKSHCETPAGPMDIFLQSSSKPCQEYLSSPCLIPFIPESNGPVNLTTGAAILFQPVIEASHPVLPTHSATNSGLKSLGLLLMLINHLVAPFLSPFIVILTGEPARHFLTMSFMSPARYRSTNYWKHARRLTFYLVLTSLAVAGIQRFFEIWILLQMPIAWLALTWLRPLVMAKTSQAAAIGCFLWIATFLCFLIFDDPAQGNIWMSGVNLLATGLVFPFTCEKITIENRAALFFLGLYVIGSITSVVLGATAQLDLVIVGLPLLLFARSCFSDLQTDWLPKALVRHSLTLYVASLAFACYFSGNS